MLKLLKTQGKIDEHHQVICVVLGHIFKDLKEYYAYHCNISITWPKYKYIGGIIQVSRLVLWEKYVWLLNNRKPTGFGGRLTVFGNNRNNMYSPSLQKNCFEHSNSNNLLVLYCTCSVRLDFPEKVAIAMMLFPLPNQETVQKYQRFEPLA